MSASESDYKFLSSAKTATILASLRFIKSPASIAQISALSDIDPVIINDHLNQLQKKGIIASCDTSLWQICNNPNATSKVDEAIDNSRFLFIEQRAKESKIDVVGRLEWIDDIVELIQRVKKTLQ